jgi:hypothetical protein
MKRLHRIAVPFATRSVRGLLTVGGGMTLAIGCLASPRLWAQAWADPGAYTPDEQAYVSELILTNYPYVPNLVPLGHQACAAMRRGVSPDSESTALAEQLGVGYLSLRPDLSFTLP